MLTSVVIDTLFKIFFSDLYPGGWIIFPHIHDAVGQSFLHVPIMGFHKFSPICSFVNGSFRCNSREGQVMGDSIFFYNFPALVDDRLMG